ncbi:MAG: GMC family oxidoreductase N-terminal domain-containing protein [Woeseiaceae bacterium]|nr:GMC family oxidoreductase N-terminal domain-containing protein [Woeseiaceae bacterium]
MNFDTVIVGGGSAGCVLAGRLSEDPHRSICLIEAGPDDRDPRIRIPLGVMTLMGNRKYDWCYRSAPHVHLGGRIVSVPRGKTLGGSGSINSMVYIRGRASDYDAWAKAGCSGWEWASVLPWFIRAENNLQLGEEVLHGSEGPLHVADLPSPHPMVSRFVAAARAVGIPANRDFNGETQEGVGAYQTTMRNGHRCSPADAYLRPALPRENLTVLTNCLVDRIDFRGRRAHSVIAHRGSERIEIGVSDQLVLSAGAVSSPAILMRSGVGPAKHLGALGIDVVLPLDGVGTNLHDHPAVGMHYGGGDDGYALSLATLPDNVLAPMRYLLGKKGLFASNTVEGGGFARTDPKLAEPDVQFHFIPARLGHEGRMLVWGRGYYSDVCLLKPRSRGELRLASRDPRAEPIIDLNLLDDEADRRTMLAGAKLLRAILARPELKSGNARELVPGPGVASDEELWDLIASRLGTAYHPVGTCRMGNADDPRCVVDPSLRVIGLENVRVADASVMPEIVAGNTNAPSMIIGEVAADRMKRGA